MMEFLDFADDSDSDEVMLMELKLLHPHCYSCYSSSCRKGSDGKCTSPDGLTTCCPLITCQLHCGASYHQCKGPEHSLLCLHERVPCINAAYGCPVIMLRAVLGRHLQVCPASVIFCSIEWNRWPMHSMEEGVKAPLPQENRHLRSKQLDVALALRDQRMLIESRKAPRRTHRILRNSLTQRHPAAPFLHHSSSFDSDNLNSADTSQTVSDDDSDAPWEYARSPPGLQRSVCNKLFRTTDEHNLNNYAGSTVECISHLVDNMRSKQSRPTKSKSLDDDSLLLSQLGRDYPVTCSHCKHRKAKHSDQALEDPSNSNCQESECLNKGCSSTAHTTRNEPSNAQQDMSLPQIQEITSSELLSGLVCQAPNCEVIAEDGCAVKEVQPIKLNELLGVALNIECMTRYQQKPRSMFTFLCAQEFRRDEYAWHYKNVHHDIHCGLNGWLEQRCPLAHSGCTFSFCRFYPDQSTSKIVHSSLVESFGVRTSKNGDDDSTTRKAHEIQPSSPLTMHFECKKKSQGKSLPKSREMTPEIITSCQYDSLVRVVHVDKNFEKAQSAASATADPDFLSMLPLEVLQQILRHVDSFSLCNLATTSKHLRDACSSLLEERGLVTLIWQKEVSEAGSRGRWKVAYKKWNFSTAFTPVKFWGFNGFNPLAEHLKVCSFNQDRPVHSEPFHLPSDSNAARRLSLLTVVNAEQNQDLPV